MFLSLIIPTHRRFFQVEKLLKSIAIQDFPAECLEILLISNFKDKLLRDKAPDWEKTFLNFKYKEVGLKGVNKARNMGIRFARGDILYFLDDDCLLPHKKQLQNVVQSHEKYPEVSGIGGPYKIKEFLSGKEKFYHENSELWLKDLTQIDNQSSQLLGGNASYKKFIFEKGYYFDPTIVFGGSEVGFNQSIKKYGLIRDEKLGVYHYPQLKGFAFIKKSFQQGRGAFKNQSKNLDQEQSFDSKWAFLHGEQVSFYSFLYQVFFKIGYFWEESSAKKRGFLPKSFQFILSLLKSRWYFLKKIFIVRLLGQLWYIIGWCYGNILARLLGQLWYVIGWSYGNILARLSGQLWYIIGWSYGNIVLFLFHHSPPMKIYYFSRYQYKKRINPFFDKKQKDKK